LPVLAMDDLVLCTI